MEEQEKKEMEGQEEENQEMEGQEIPEELKSFVEEVHGEEAEEGEGKKKKKGKGKGKKKAEKKEPKPRRDNIAYVQDLRNIKDVRKFSQTAVAKRAKSIDRPEAVERYEREIEVSKQVLADLLAEAASAENPLQAYIDLGEEPNKILTHFIQSKEAEYDAWVETNEFKVPKSTLKNINDDVPDSFFDILPLDLHQTLVERHGKSDFRLRAICKKINFIQKVEDGLIVNQEGKWFDPEAEKVNPE